MEMSLIGSSPAKLSGSRRELPQLSNDSDTNNLTMIRSFATNSQIGFGRLIKHRSLPLRVTASSLSHSQPPASIEASQDLTVSNHEDGVKLYVGLPMNSVSDCNTINNSRAISAGLRALKLLGVEGVELPIWWGVAEKEAMGKYEWSGYLTLVRMVQEAGLKLHVSLCFHASKEENIPLPNWVTEIGESQPDIFFSDHSGARYKECLSFGVDDLPVFSSRTAMQVYEGFVESFKSLFHQFMGSTITGVTIGLGPDGELRYPSHQNRNKSGDGHGGGEFQCYDKNMMSNLKQQAELIGKPLWGLSGPHDAPTYNQQPIINTFFKDGGSWETPYGDFFLSWYSTQLESHADRMLSLAASAFSETPIMVSGKLPLIASWYRSRSHPAEATAGFYNTVKREGYEEIMMIFSKNSCRMILPGMDLLDEQQPNESCSSPELLHTHIRDACRSHGIEVCGQNLHIAGNSKSFEQIKKNLLGTNGIHLFIYQRMGAEFFSPKNFPLFSAFVRSLNQMELDSDDLGANAVFVPGKNRKLQVV